jgi:hypothetical protein
MFGFSALALHPPLQKQNGCYRLQMNTCNTRVIRFSFKIFTHRQWVAQDTSNSRPATILTMFSHSHTKFQPLMNFLDSSQPVR